MEAYVAVFSVHFLYLGACALRTAQSKETFYILGIPLLQWRRITLQGRKADIYNETSLPLSELSDRIWWLKG